jgi:hypothetical protein
MTAELTRESSGITSIAAVYPSDPKPEVCLEDGGQGAAEAMDGCDEGVRLLAWIPLNCSRAKNYNESSRRDVASLSLSCG